MNEVERGGEGSSTQILEMLILRKVDRDNWLKYCNWNMILKIKIWWTSMCFLFILEPLDLIYLAMPWQIEWQVRGMMRWLVFAVMLQCPVGEGGVGGKDEGEW